MFPIRVIQTIHRNWPKRSRSFLRMALRLYPMPARRALAMSPKLPPQEVAIQSPFVLLMANDRLKTAALSQLSADDRCNPASLVGDEHLCIRDAMSPVTPIHVTSFRFDLGQALHLLQAVDKGVSIIRITR